MYNHSFCISCDPAKNRIQRLDLIKIKYVLLSPCKLLKDSVKYIKKNEKNHEPKELNELSYI